MTGSRHLSVAAFLLLTGLPASASQSQFTRRDPPPEGQRITARDGDIIVIENDDRVRLVRRRQANARVVVDEGRSLVVVLADWIPREGPPDGLVDQTWRYTIADGRWPFEAKWEGPVTIEADDVTSGRAGHALALETSSGLVLFDNGPPGRGDTRGAVAVLRFQAFSGGGGGQVGFDQSERQQLSNNPPPAQYSSFSTGPGVASGAWGSASSGTSTVVSGSSTMPVRAGNFQAPRKIHNVYPAMPPEAIKANVQGIVILEITVAEDGSVRNPRVLRSIPMLDQAALEAVSQWRYEVPLVNGQPTAVTMTVTVQFTRQPQ